MEQKINYKPLIVIASIAIPVVVAILIQVRIDGYDFSYLPHIYAVINALTAILLIAALVAIKQGKRKVHEAIMKVNMALSAAFLVMYILYHITTDPTIFGGTGWVRYAYLFLLISHITLSIAITPLVLFTLLHALNNDFSKHRELAKYSFPVWFYIAITGVIIYLMISPYYK
jgi:putative membrane protein